MAPARGTTGRPAVAVCADVGSTFTKVAVVDLDTGVLVATADHRTTAETDVLDGLDAAVAAATATLPAGADTSTVLVCSSAGGGLRLAVVGYEQLVTAEAGHRVGLTAGARVVHVAAGRLDRAGVAALRGARPDLVLLVGGTDGGDADVLRHNAARLGTARLRVPVVVAGNAEANDDATATLRARGIAAVPAANVLPRIGEINPGPARSAIREAFLRHVIGGKRLSTGPRFAGLVRGATPDLVLTGVELLAERISGQDRFGDLAVVDVGGATTDVYTILSPDPDQPRDGHTQVAGTLWHSRTVEGDLGVRAGAPGVVAAALAERLVTGAEADLLAAPAAVRTAEPGLLPVTENDRTADLRLAELAATIALRRHARRDGGGSDSLMSGGARSSGKDLRRVGLVVGSGGVLRHAGARAAAAMLGRVLADHGGGWALPRSAALTVDRDHVLAPAGLLAEHRPAAARALLDRHLLALLDRRLLDRPC